MTKIQAKRLLALASSVAKAKNYDQNDCDHCAMSHVPRTDRLVEEYYGLSDEQCHAIFSVVSPSEEASVTAKTKAAQIRRIANTALAKLTK